MVEQKRVVARLDANDVMHPSLTQVAKVGGVGAEGVFDDDDRQVGMLLAKPFEPAAGGVPLAIVLGLTILLDDRLGCQRDDFLEVGIDQGGPQQLMGIGDVAVAMLLHQARGGNVSWRRKNRSCRPATPGSGRPDRRNVSSALPRCRRRKISRNGARRPAGSTGSRTARIWESEGTRLIP